MMAPRLRKSRPAPCPKGCDHALEFALITAPEKRSAAMKKKLEAVAGPDAQMTGASRCATSEA